MTCTLGGGGGRGQRLHKLAGFREPSKPVPAHRPPQLGGGMGCGVHGRAGGSGHRRKDGVVGSSRKGVKASRTRASPLTLGSL